MILELLSRFAGRRVSTLISPQCILYFYARRLTVCAAEFTPRGRERPTPRTCMPKPAQNSSFSGLDKKTYLYEGRKRGLGIMAVEKCRKKIGSARRRGQSTGYDLRD